MSDGVLGRAGERIAERFELRAPLADAGLGEPWSAIDRTVSDRAVVVKLLPGGARPEAWSTACSRLRYLGNPRLPKLIDAGETSDGRRWVAIEWVKGRSLSNWLDGHAQAGTWPGFGVILRLFDAVSSAVQVGHGAGGRQLVVLHRGLSPRSVMIDAIAGGHHVVLLDHEMGPFVDSRSVWEYRAPELLGRSGAETPASDVFALAVMLVHLLGRRATPTQGSQETWAELALRGPRHVKGALRALNTDVPGALWEAIADALNADVAKRIAEAQSFARRLRQAVAPGWKQLPTVEREPPAPTRLPAGAVVATREAKASVNAPDGWQWAERRPWLPPTNAETGGASSEFDTVTHRARSQDASEGLVTLLDDEIVARRDGESSDEGGATLVDEEARTPFVKAAEPDDAGATLTDYTPQNGRGEGDGTDTLSMELHAHEGARSPGGAPHTLPMGRRASAGAGAGPHTLPMGMMAQVGLTPGAMLVEQTLVGDPPSVVMAEAVRRRAGGPGADPGRPGAVADATRVSATVWVVVSLVALGVIVAVAVALLAR